MPAWQPEHESAPTDAEVIGRSRDDPEAFAAVFDRYADDVHRYVARRVGQMADDLVAETFLIALRTRSGFRSDAESARPWLFGIANNLIARHRRAERARYRALSRLAIATSGYDDHEAATVSRLDADVWTPALAAALARLKPRDRDVLTLVAFAGLPHAEVAEALHVPVGTVRSRLHRARTQLRAALPSDLSTIL